MKIQLLRIFERLVSNKSTQTTMYVVDIEIETGMWWWRRTQQRQFVRKPGSIGAVHGTIGGVNYIDADNGTEPSHDLQVAIEREYDALMQTWRQAALLAELAGEQKEVWRAPSLMIDETLKTAGKNTVRKGPHR